MECDSNVCLVLAELGRSVQLLELLAGHARALAGQAGIATKLLKLPADKYPQLFARKTSAVASVNSFADSLVMRGIVCLDGNGRTWIFDPHFFKCICNLTCRSQYQSVDINAIVTRNFQNNYFIQNSYSAFGRTRPFGSPYQVINTKRWTPDSFATI